MQEGYSIIIEFYLAHKSTFSALYFSAKCSNQSKVQSEFLFLFKRQNSNYERSNKKIIVTNSASQIKPSTRANFLEEPSLNQAA